MNTTLISITDPHETAMLLSTCDPQVTYTPDIRTYIVFDPTTNKAVTLHRVSSVISYLLRTIDIYQREKEELEDSLKRSQDQFNVMAEISQVRRELSNIQGAALEAAQQRVQELEEFVYPLSCQDDFNLGQSQLIVQGFVNQTLEGARALCGDNRD